MTHCRATNRGTGTMRTWWLRTAALGTVLAAAAPLARAQDAARSAAPEAKPATTALESATNAISTGEIVVTATRSQRDPFHLPWAVSVASTEDLQRSGNFVGAKALTQRNAAIWYDDRTGSTTDLIVRGFAGFNLLTLVDGNTLSTLWGEGGFGADDMYGKIDPEMIERIEVVRGPATATYGSNALGAVVNFVSRVAPVDFPEEDCYVSGGRLRLVAQSVNDAGGVRLEGWGATKDLRLLVGGSARDYDHLRGGGDIHLMKPTDGREQNWDLSAEWRIVPKRTLRFTYQDVHRDHVKRYYRPKQDNENDREAGALFYQDATQGGFFDRVEARLYVQEKVDRRRFFDTGKIGVATTDTIQGGFQGVRTMGGGHLLTAGVAAERHDGDSPDDEQFTYVVPAPKKRDAPLSVWTDVAAYALDEWTVNDDWSLFASTRAGRMKLETDVDSAYTPAIGSAKDSELSDSTSYVTGGLGVVWRAQPGLNLLANWSRGFRQNAPNFGTRQLGDGVLIPNDLLDPTTSDNFEIGAKGRGEGFRWEAFAYESRISNWQGDLRPATLNGASYLDVNGNGVRDANEGYVTQVEGGDAYVHGIELAGSMQPHHVISEAIPADWSLWASLARNIGRVDATDANPHEEPLRHTQPTRLLAGVRWDDTEHASTGLYVELIADVVNRYSSIPTDRLNGDLAWREDAQDGSSPLLRSYGGAPGYTTFSIHAGVNVTESVKLRLGVENLTNKKYRSAHSRMDAPGINVVASLEIRF